MTNAFLFVIGNSMSIVQALKFAIDKLSANNIINNPRFEAEILLSDILKKPREFLLAYGEYKLTKSQIKNYKLQIAKRLKNMPIAYIIGEKEFYGLKFKVNKNVLIPRPETELMIEEALKLINKNNLRCATVIDIGTGSGCVIIAFAKQIINLKLKISNFKFLAIDISKKVLIAAKQNSKIHDVNKNIKFLCGNLLEPLLNKSKIINPKSKIIILANLPYLTLTQIKNSLTIKHEPRLALFGGKNGLELYEKLFQQINYLIQNTKYKIQNPLFALCEIDPRQTNRIKRLVKKYLPQAKLRIKKDLLGLNRIAFIAL